MASVVSICNLALSFLGDSASVASIEPPESSTQAQLCAQFYPIAVSALLEMHDWSFATAKVALSPYEFGEEYHHGWRFNFAIPSDCLRVISIKDLHVQQPYHYPPFLRIPLLHDNPVQLKYEIKGKILYANTPQPILEYITSNTNVSRFSPTFVTALAYYLAHLLAGARVKGQEGQRLAQQLLKEFQMVVSTAKTLDASQQQKRLDFVPRWLMVR